MFGFNFNQDKSGAGKAVAALPLILFIGGIIVEIGAAGLILAYFLTQSGFGVKLSAEALAAAQAGVEDATIKVVRDKNFAGGVTTIKVGARTAEVSVVKDSPSVGKYKITSVGSALNKRRKLEAVLNVDGLTGEVKMESIVETAL